MKFNIEITVLLFGAFATTLATTNTTVGNIPIDPAKIAECGSAENVMVIPEGANATEYRTCIEHPLGRAGPKDTESLEKRSCWYGAKTGCSGGYCWKRCGEDLKHGYWCWTALDHGHGPWYKCTADSQCWDYMACGQGANCASCGCSC